MFHQTATLGQDARASTVDKLLYLVARLTLALIQALPLRAVARMGRVCGGLAYWLDGRHRRVAQRQLTMCFGNEKSVDEIRALAKENFRRIGENFACAAKTASMTFEELRPHVEFIYPPNFLTPSDRRDRQSIVVAIGHFGNFELHARFAQVSPGYKCATTYRGVRQPSINRLLRDLRERSGCLFFERRTDGAALKAAMNECNLILGLLADQHGGNHGLRIPFLGHDCSTSSAPAVFALRYHCVLHTGICYRVGLAQWRIEAGPEIPTHENGAARSSEAIMREVNRAFEEAVRRDPANWFWVHNRWKPIRPVRRKVNKPTLANVEELE
jgi:lauroyl/myristoyl acyltransferase